MKTKLDSVDEAEIDQLLSGTIQELVKALPQMIAKRDFHFAKAEAMNSKIHAAHSMVRAFTPQPQPQDTAISPGTGSLNLSGRAPQRRVYEHVDQVLNDGKERGFGGLKAEMAKQFGISYGTSSIYRALRKGEADSRYLNKDGKWSIRAKK